jgi:hypothetical protein
VTLAYRRAGVQAGLAGRRAGLAGVRAGLVWAGAEAPCGGLDCSRRAVGWQADFLNKNSKFFILFT